MYWHGGKAFDLPPHPLVGQLSKVRCVVSIPDWRTKMLGMRGVDPAVERAWRLAALKIGVKPKREIWISSSPQGWLVEVGYSDGSNLHAYRQFQERDWDNVQRIVANHTKRFRCPIKIEGFYAGESFDYR